MFIKALLILVLLTYVSYAGTIVTHKLADGTIVIVKYQQDLLCSDITPAPGVTILDCKNYLPPSGGGSPSVFDVQKLLGEKGLEETINAENVQVVDYTTTTEGDDPSSLSATGLSSVDVVDIDDANVAVLRSFTTLHTIKTK